MIEPAALELDIEQVALHGRAVVGPLRVSCPPGKHTVILGPNGAGKTTLLRGIVGLLKVRGSIKLNGRELATLASRERARLLAYVPQRSSLTAALRVREVVLQGRFVHQTEFGAAKRSDLEAVERALHQADMGAFTDRVFTQLSGGEQRRVLLARALATEAPVLILDEPTSFLDIAHSIQLFHQIDRLRGLGHTILSVLHGLADAERWADQAVVLERGKVRYTGPAQLPAELVEAVYGVRVLPRSVSGYQLLEDA